MYLRNDRFITLMYEAAEVKLKVAEKELSGRGSYCSYKLRPLFELAVAQAKAEFNYWKEQKESLYCKRTKLKIKE